MRKPNVTPWKHSHSFGQDVRRSGETRTIIVIAITATMMIVEIVGGIAFGSMALLADGMHMASHAVALGINVFAYIYARKHAHDERFSFGTGKVNALGGFSGAVLLALFALMMAWESIERLIVPTEIVFNSAIIVAVIGLIVNGASVFILGEHHHHEHSHDTHDHEHSSHNHGHPVHEHHHDHNLRSAYFHVLADALTSLTAIIALLAAKYFGWIWMDPLMGIVGSLLVAKWSISLLKQSSRLLLDHQAPEDVTQTIVRAIQTDDTQIADLHAWSIGPGIYSVILSIVTTNPQPPNHYKERLESQKIPHVTVEVQVVGESSSHIE